MKAASARTKSTESTYKRLLALQEKKLVSPEAVENSRDLADSAKAEMEATKQVLALLEKGRRD